MIAKKRKKRKFNQETLASMLSGIFLLAIISLFIFYNLKINQKRRELLSQIEKLEKEIRALEEKNTQLQTGISQTETEDYWEGVVRQQGYVKEGEEQIVVLPAESLQPEIKEEQSFWNPQDWWDKISSWFKNKLRD